jgi:hypothetical protein
VKKKREERLRQRGGLKGRFKVFVGVDNSTREDYEPTRAEVEHPREIAMPILRLYAIQTVFIEDAPEEIQFRLPSAVFTMSDMLFYERCVPSRHATWL